MDGTIFIIIFFLQDEQKLQNVLNTIEELGAKVNFSQNRALRYLQVFENLCTNFTVMFLNFSKNISGEGMQ